MAMLRLPRLQHIAMCVAHPEVVVERVDLDHVGAEVGEQLGAAGPGDGQPEVEHDDAVERCAPEAGPVSTAGAPDPRAGSASASTSSVCSPGPAGGASEPIGAGGESVDLPDLADRHRARGRRPR